MVGVFIVDKFSDSIRVEAHSKADDRIRGTFYLPPLNRQETSGIQSGTSFFGIVDEVTGMGALLVALEDDFSGEFSYKLKAKDFTDGTLSLGSHAHGAGTIANSAGTCAGATGNSIAYPVPEA